MTESHCAVCGLRIRRAEERDRPWLHDDPAYDPFKPPIHAPRLADVANEHAATYQRYRRGKSPVFGRQCWGYRVLCSCGFEQRVNGTKREAESVHRSHVRAR